jgi:hypothetical protein
VIAEILLMADVLVGGDENVEPGLFGSRNQSAIFQLGPSQLECRRDRSEKIVRNGTGTF